MTTPEPDYGRRYTVRLEVMTEGDVHVRAFQTYFDLRKPEEKQLLLDRVAIRLAREVGTEMFATYRPSAEELLHAQYMRFRGGRK